MFIKYILFYTVLVLTSVYGRVINTNLPEAHDDKFYYFGYGSNMLTDRIHIQNPTAVKIGAAELKDYRLDFNGFTQRWNGAPATIVPTKNATVYGTLWDIDLINLSDIDNQEGVSEGIYYSASVPVILANNTVLVARAYLLVEQPKTELNIYEDDDVPLDRQPSKSYLQCLVKGAIETGIPTSYVNWLQSVKHNGRVANDLEDLLQLKNVELGKKMK